MTRSILLLSWIFLMATADRTEELFTALKARDVDQVRAILAADPSLANAKVEETSATERAMFFVANDGFVPVQSNDVLKVVLAQKPKLDLFETAALGDTKALKKLLDADPKAVRAKNHFGWSPIHMACFAGNVENVKLLLDRGADINKRAETRFRNTPLLVSMLTGQYEVAKLLLERGADVLDRQAKGFTAIHEASLLGRNDIVQLLLDHGAEINSRSDDGRTAYSEALRGKHPETAEFLKTKGATTETSENLQASPD